MGHVSDVSVLELCQLGRRAQGPTFSAADAEELAHHPTALHQPDDLAINPVSVRSSIQFLVTEC